MLLPTCIQHVWESIAQKTKILIFPIVFQRFCVDLVNQIGANWDQKSINNRSRNRSKRWSKLWSAFHTTWANLKPSLASSWQTLGLKGFNEQVAQWLIGFVKPKLLQSLPECCPDPPERSPKIDFGWSDITFFVDCLWTRNDSLVDFR